MWNKIRERAAAHPNWLLALAVLLALGPFLAKPFNMDDPLFIWTARQIHAHPMDPYGFNVNWDETASPMWSVTENPPLASYYLALSAGIFGWSEIALHGAFLLPALAVILGTYRLARRFCDPPLLATLAALFTPVFLVSSSTVMCDALMLAFWVWAVVLWVEGMEREAFWPLAGAGLLIALAALTKYYGACLIPLLAVYSLTNKRRLGWWAASLLIPLLALCAWQWATRTLYQHDLLLKAADYASRKHNMSAGAKAAAGMTALSFTGGCLAMIVFLSPWLWRARALLSLLGVALLLAFVTFREGSLWQTYPWIQGWFGLATEAQIILWAFGGMSVLALAVADVWRHRDACSWLLALWVVGTFIFTAALNWTVNGRSILPMAPAVGILLTRRLQQRAGVSQKKPAIGRRRILIPLAAGAVFASLVARSDYLLADAVRQSALLAHERHGGSGHTLWFQGHWGFQYYMEQLGGQAVDTQQPPPRVGDVLAIPVNNTSLRFPGGPRQGFYVGEPRFLITQNMYVGAGFYSAVGGPLPFAFGHVPREYVTIYTLQPGP